MITTLSKDCNLEIDSFHCYLLQLITEFPEAMGFRGGDDRLYGLAQNLLTFALHPFQNDGLHRVKKNATALRKGEDSSIFHKS
jgi:hypothetical protein